MATLLGTNVLADILMRVDDVTAARGLPTVCKAFHRAWDLHAYLAKHGASASALMHAARAGRMEDVLCLQAAGVDVWNHSTRALAAAADHAHAPQVAAKDSAQRRKELPQCNHCKVAQFMLDHGADAGHALLLAAEKGYAAAIPFLAQHTPDATNWRLSALEAAACAMDVLTAHALLLEGLDASQYVTLAQHIHLFASADLDAVATLVAAGMDPEHLKLLLSRRMQLPAQFDKSMQSACMRVLDHLQQCKRTHEGSKGGAVLAMQCDAAAFWVRVYMRRELLHVAPLLPCTMAMFVGVYVVLWHLRASISPGLDIEPDFHSFLIAFAASPAVMLIAVMLGCLLYFLLAGCLNMHEHAVYRRRYGCDILLTVSTAPTQ